jgi:hypothetical protein
MYVGAYKHALEEQVLFFRLGMNLFLQSLSYSMVWPRDIHRYCAWNILLCQSTYVTGFTITYVQLWSGYKLWQKDLRNVWSFKNALIYFVVLYILHTLLWSDHGKCVCCTSSAWLVNGEITDVSFNSVLAHDGWIGSSGPGIHMPTYICTYKDEPRFIHNDHFSVIWSHFWLYWTLFSKNIGQNWWKLVKIDDNWSDWWKLVKNDENWSKLMKIGHNWRKLVKIDENWSKSIATKMLRRPIFDRI